MRSIALAVAAAVSAAGLLLADVAGAGPWELLPAGEGAQGPVARVCADPTGEGAASCLALGCATPGPIHWELSPDTALTLPEVLVEVGGRDAGTLSFAAAEGAAADAPLVAGYDPDFQDALVGRLRKGARAVLVWATEAGEHQAEVSLTGSSRALGAVLEACPMPVIPVADPAARVLREVRKACSGIGGEVRIEPGFKRIEDIDGDGLEDMVVDYAAASCDKRASLNCTSRGCTVGFFRATDEGFDEIFVGAIRGYEVEPDGVLALDLHGDQCGVFGFEPCRKRFEVAPEGLALIETLTGEAALGEMDGGLPSADEAPTDVGLAAIAAVDEAEVAALTESGEKPEDGATPTDEAAATEADEGTEATEAPAEAPDTTPEAAPEANAVAEADPAPEPEPDVVAVAEAPEPEPTDEPAVEPAPVVVSTSETAPEPEAESESEPEAESESEPEAVADPDPETPPAPVVVAAPAPEPEAESEPAEEPAEEPTVAPEPAPEPASAPEPGPTLAPAPEPAPADDEQEAVVAEIVETCPQDAVDPCVDPDPNRPSGLEWLGDGGTIPLKRPGVAGGEMILPEGDSLEVIQLQ